MSQKKATVETYEDVLHKFMQFFLSQQKDSLLEFQSANQQEKEVIVEEFNTLLDELRDDDMFGTEGQLDPRGDNRD